MDIVTLAAARKGGGGGDVTRAYVDEHLALKADKSETQQYPIGGNVSGDAISVSDSADANVQGLTVYGRSEVSKNLISTLENGGIASDGSDQSVPNPTRVRTPSGKKIAVDASKKYTLNAIATLTGYTPSGSIHQYASDDTYIGYIGWVDLPYTFDLSSNCARVRVTLRYADNSDVTVDSFKDVQLELGSTPTPYEPYGEIYSIGDSGSLAITSANSDSSESSTATLTTGLPLCGIPVTTGETYTDRDGVKWLADSESVEGIVHRCYKITLDGSEDENWQVYSPSVTGEGDSKRIDCDNALTLAIIRHNDTSTGLAIAVGLTLATPQQVHTAIIENSVFVGSSGSYNAIGVRVSGINTVSALRTYLASNPVTIVYAIATPTTQELTPTEKSALLALRTFDSATNITVTDDPFVDISYIKNTANGKAAEQLADNLRASIGWISAVPEMHRNILRGKYLGTSVTAAQLAAIADGSFDDLYVGDYWTINNTVYRIADMDFFRTDANSPFLFTTHHLVIVPDGTMYKAKMNDSSATTSGGYKNSDMRTTNLATAKATINTDFPNMVLTYKDLLVTATSSGMPTASDYFDCDIELMSETMLFGGYVNAKPSNPPYFCASTNPTQFALFKLNPQFIITDKSETIWLRDAADGARFCTMEYSPFGRDANYADGAVRPFFLIGDAT